MELFEDNQKQEAHALFEQISNENPEDRVARYYMKWCTVGVLHNSAAKRTFKLKCSQLNTSIEPSCTTPKTSNPGVQVLQPAHPAN